MKYKNLKTVENYLWKRAMKNSLTLIISDLRFEITIENGNNKNTFPHKRFHFNFKIQYSFTLVSNKFPLEIQYLLPHLWREFLFYTTIRERLKNNYLKLLNLDISILTTLQIKLNGRSLYALWLFESVFCYQRS